MEQVEWIDPLPSMKSTWFNFKCSKQFLHDLVGYVGKSGGNRRRMAKCLSCSQVIKDGRAQELRKHVSFCKEMSLETKQLYYV
jgi:hypothetical protein